jgi:selenocysteine lyase/cysteine desulfurase
MAKNFQSYYPYFKEKNPNLLHFAPHSHHPWPDVSFNGHQQYWLDSNQLTDRKWDKIFSETIPNFQHQVAKMLGVKAGNQIAIAPNTGEFVARIFSCFHPNERFKILTTDSEFHSFNRQAERLNELSNVELVKIATEPFETFEERFLDAIEDDIHLIFISQVFFNSGWSISQKFLHQLKAKAHSFTLIVIDVYHSFAAFPLDFSKFDDRFFIIGGCYKYAQAGEGACFLYVPPGLTLRPINTGWFAHFEGLSESGNKIEYSDGAMGFMGATFDASGLYRFNSIWSLFEQDKIEIADIHEHVLDLQMHFLKAIKGTFLADLPCINQHTNPENRAHFLTFRTEQAANYHQQLMTFNILTDFRVDRLRFGFGMHQKLEDIDELIHRMKTISV